MRSPDNSAATPRVIPQVGQGIPVTAWSGQTGVGHPLQTQPAASKNVNSSTDPQISSGSVLLGISGRQ